MTRSARLASAALILATISVGAGLAAWKIVSVRHASAASASPPEPVEAVEVAVARPRQHRRTTTAIGTVIALRSITLRNELPGTVREIRFVPGQIVQAGALLVALDVSVEEAELAAQEAQAAAAESLLRRVQRASQNRAASEAEVDRARAERDVALAQMARIRAIIARKTLRAPFRARVGLADVHPGQYLNEGSQITTLQGVDDAAHVDFAVPQPVAAGLRVGQRVEIFTGSETSSTPARIVAFDARIDPATRNAAVRARIEDAANGPRPGASVRVLVPVGPPETAVVVPVSALRRDPGGDHVFVIAPGADGKPRAQRRPVESGPLLGDDVLIHRGLAAGEQVATTGSFKLRDAVLVAVAGQPGPGGTTAR